MEIYKLIFKIQEEYGIQKFIFKDEKQFSFFFERCNKYLFVGQIFVKELVINNVKFFYQLFLGGCDYFEDCVFQVIIIISLVGSVLEFVGEIVY